MRAIRTVVATTAVVVLAIAGVTAAVANDPPPRIAFLANGIVPADALAAGPIAGQLGAPIFTTAQDALPTSTANALDAYNPELVIVMGGPVAIADAVLGEVAAATGLSVVSPTPPPTSGIVRAAGQDRFQTAAAAAALLAAYAPAYLPTDSKAIDADRLDGKDSTAFQPAGDYLGKTQKAADADRLDGKDGSNYAARSDTFSWVGSDVHTGKIELDDTDPDTVLAGFTATLPDECGSNTTSHRLIIDSTANITWGPSTFGEPYGGTAFVFVDGTAEPSAGGVGADGIVGTPDPARGQRSGSGIVTLAPGTYTFELVDLAGARVATDTILRYWDPRLTVTHAGWTCG